MGDPIPNSIWKIWDDWNIRGFILLSLSLQTFLILCAPLRKRTSSMWIMSLIWTAYLLADWVANFTIGLIASSQRDKGHGGIGGGPIDVHLLAFWAPFLLIHLGGPDTISSFSLEDNAFWLRHSLGLLFHVVATLYVFLQSLGAKNNYKLWFPTLVLFLTGIIKYAERIRALYLGSVDGLKNSVKENEYHIEMNLNRDHRQQSYHENNIGMVQCAYDLFERFSKGLIADLLFTSRDFRQLATEHFFCRRSPEESFHIIAAELNFIYETLFTKLYVAHTKLGYFFRVMSFVATSIAIVCFYKLDKHGLHRFDVVITYTLICGAMTLDSIALFMLIFSDWTVAAARELLSKDSCVTSILLKYIDLKSPKWYSSNTKRSFLGWSRQILFGRCSESIYTFNVIDYALKESQKMTSPSSVIGHICRIFYLKTIGLFRGCLQYFRAPSIRRQPSSEGEGGGGVLALGVRVDPTQVIAPKWGSFFGLQDLLDKIKYRSSKPLSKDLWEFIFNDLREKKNNEEGFFDLWEARGNWILRYNHSYGDCTGLSHYVVDYDYEQSLIVWHIATELCYNSTSQITRQY